MPRRLSSVHRQFNAPSNAACSRPRSEGLDVFCLYFTISEMGKELPSELSTVCSAEKSDRYHSIVCRSFHGVAASPTGICFVGTSASRRPSTSQKERTVNEVRAREWATGPNGTCAEDETAFRGPPKFTMLRKTVGRFQIIKRLLRVVILHKMKRQTISECWIDCPQLHDCRFENVERCWNNPSKARAQIWIRIKLFRLHDVFLKLDNIL